MVDYDLFVDWAQSYFGANELKTRRTSHGIEICANSPFSESAIGKVDTKKHLWMNPSGGKSKHPENGSYRCWLTDTRGSLVSLVSTLENISWSQARSRISKTETLEDVFNTLVSNDQNLITNLVVHKKQHLIELPPSSILIDELPSHNKMKSEAEKVLKKRKIPTRGLYLCLAGKLRNRIIIPYYNPFDELIFYNTRAIDDNNPLRYVKCVDGNQDDILYFPEWPEPNNRVFLVEGEFDAKSLYLCDFFAAGCGGKYLSDSQVDLLRDYYITLALDNDAPGLKALIEIGDQLLGLGFKELNYIRPPEGFKDWNALYQEHNKETVRNYIEKNKSVYSSYTKTNLLMV